jgi:diguanylate cyclase (GGDEF)-like protein
MSRLLAFLEKHLGLAGAHSLLFYITWMLLFVLFSFLHVNALNAALYKSQQDWQPFINQFLKEQVGRIGDVSADSLAALQANYYAVDEDVEGVAHFSSDKSSLYLLDIVSSDDNAKLNFFAPKKLAKPLGFVVDRVYPETPLNNLFVGVGLADMSSFTLDATVSDSDRYTYSFLFTENRYFLLLIDREKRDSQGNFSGHVHFYLLSEILRQFMLDTYTRSASELRVESRLYTRQLSSNEHESLVEADLVFGWDHLGLPVKYRVAMPITLGDMNFVWVTSWAGIATVVLYLLLYLYGYSERKSNWIKNRNNRFAQLIDASFDATFWANNLGEINHCNQAALNMLGIEDPSEVLSVPLVDLFHCHSIDRRLLTVPYTKNLRVQTFVKANERVFYANVSLFVFTELEETLVFVQDINDEHENDKKLLYQATYDSLTGLKNRSSLMQALETCVKSRRKKPTAVLFIDLDGFKHVNDSLGHSAGDRLLISAAKRMMANLEGSRRSACYRFGGDEFVILLERYTAENTESVVETLLRAFDESITLDEHDIKISLSIGISMIENDDISTEEALRNADAAMYQSKETSEQIGDHTQTQ